MRKSTIFWALIAVLSISIGTASAIFAGQGKVSSVISDPG